MSSEKEVLEMTPPICRCGKELTEESHPAGREFDVCVAKERNPKLNSSQYLRRGKYLDDVSVCPPITVRNLRHYSTDIRDVLPLLKDGIIVVGKDGYGILPADYLTNPPVKTEFIVQAKTLAHAIALAFLIGEVKPSEVKPSDECYICGGSGEMNSAHDWRKTIPCTQCRRSDEP